MQEKLPDHQLRFSDVVLTALIPASIFFAAYVYEYGFFSYFNAPSQFIRLDWTTALGAIFDSWPSWWWEGAIGGSILLSLGSSLSPLTDGEFYRLRGLVFTLLLQNILLFRAITAGTLFFADFIVLGIIFSWALRIRKKGVATVIDPGQKFVHYFNWLSLTLGKRQSINLFAAVLILIIAFDAGWNTAQNQAWYFVRNDGLALALIVNTGDTQIYSPFRKAQPNDCDGADPCYLRTDAILIEKLPDHEVVRLNRQHLGALRESSLAWLQTAPYWQRSLSQMVRHN